MDKDQPGRQIGHVPLRRGIEDQFGLWISCLVLVCYAPVRHVNRLSFRDTSMKYQMGPDEV